MIANSLIEILDGIVLLYHIAAHKQLGKVGRTSWKYFFESHVDKYIQSNRF